ncbi:hypothetical protein FA200_18730 [Pseudomonas aeruginosa]|nr:hypothetical protein [Pseudomonas aeruginosa]PTZ20890.1 hypothetical protein DB382_06165 [Pseudomonas aeruginosa]
MRAGKINLSPFFAFFDFSHFVVVDGVTTRNGVSVVAIRDPHGTQYFSPVAIFEKSFTGEVVVPRSALK